MWFIAVHEEDTRSETIGAKLMIEKVFMEYLKYSLNVRKNMSVCEKILRNVIHLQPEGKNVYSKQELKLDL